MKVIIGLVFCKTTGKLVGFTEMGTINDEIEKFSRLCENDEVEPMSVSKYVMVFMARGLCRYIHQKVIHITFVVFNACRLSQLFCLSIIIIVI